MRVREKLGWRTTWARRISLAWRRGNFAFYAGTMPEKAELVEKELLSEADLLRAEGLTRKN
jgi:hypothetical protein